MTSEELLQIFYSGFDGGPNWMVLDELELLINDNAILVTKKAVSTISEYKKYLDNERLIADGLGPQGKGHMALKMIGGKFLERKGLMSKYESYFLGLHPDVSDFTHTVIIECGTTDPSGVLIFLEDGGVEWVGVIPYPAEGEEKIFLHKFIKTRLFDKYLESKVNRLRENFRKAQR